MSGVSMKILNGYGVDTLLAAIPLPAGMPAPLAPLPVPAGAPHGGMHGGAHGGGRTIHTAYGGLMEGFRSVCLVRREWCVRLRVPSVCA